jgi:hypothetical protein
MKVEKSSFWLLFFCFGKKSKRRNIVLFFLFSIAQKKACPPWWKTKRSSARKIQLPTIFLVAKIPETRCRSSASNSRKF